MWVWQCITPMISRPSGHSASGRPAGGPWARPCRCGSTRRRCGSGTKRSTRTPTGAAAHQPAGLVGQAVVGVADHGLVGGPGDAQHGSRQDIGRSDRQNVAMWESPFPPIADYGFLSDCETTALVAPSGNVEWLCLPRLDSPSVFGAILDRDAGGFRLGPGRRDGARRPAATCRARWCWRRAGARRRGWIIVRDALLIGPWHHEDELSQTPPARADRLRRRPRAAAHRPLRQRRGAGRARLRADVRLRPAARRAGTYTDRGYHQACRTTRRPRWARAHADHRHAASASRAAGRTARTLLQGGRHAASARCRGPSTSRRTTYDEAVRAAGLDRAPLAALAGPRRLPRPPVAQPPAAQRAHAEGPDLRADRRAASRRRPPRCPRRPAASATGTTATRWIRDSTFALWALYTLGFDWEANDFFCFIADVRRARRRAADHVRRRRRARPRREILDHLARLRGRPAGAHRQRRLQASASTTCGARCSTRSTSTPGRATASTSASGRSCSARSRRPSTTGASRTAASGRCAASRSTSRRRR